jgi:hypothetical protein
VNSRRTRPSAKLRRARGVEHVDLAGREHLGERLAGRDRLDVHARRRIVGQFGHAARGVQPTGAVGECGDGNLMPFGQNAFNPHVGGQLPFGHASHPSGQVSGVVDAAGRADVDGVVAEGTGGESGDRDEWRVALQRHDIGRKRHLGGVELPVPQHAEERLLHRQREPRQFDALRLDLAAG